jgi:hypothetical protein
MHGAIRNFTLIAAAAALVTASATPAMAGTGARGSDPLACLTNSSAWCLHPYGGSTAGGAEIDIYNKNDSTNGDSWTFDQVGTFTFGADAPEYEIHAGSTGECIGLSSFSSTSADAILASCGANGTVWIWYYHTDGFFLFSRYWWDNASSLLPLVAHQLGNNQSVRLDPAFNTDGAWAQWSN